MAQVTPEEPGLGRGEPDQRAQEPDHAPDGDGDAPSPGGQLITSELDLSHEEPSAQADLRREWFSLLLRLFAGQFDTRAEPAFDNRAERATRPRFSRVAWSDRLFRLFASGAYVLFSVVAALFTAMVMTGVVLRQDASSWTRLALGTGSFVVVLVVAMAAPRLIFRDANYIGANFRDAGVKGARFQEHQEHNER
jgi:hypothetical protein